MTDPKFVRLTENYTARTGPTTGTPYQALEAFVFIRKISVFGDNDMYVVQGPGNETIHLPEIFLERTDVVPWLDACAV